MAQLSRRRFLQVLAMGAMAAGCSPLIDQQLAQPLPMIGSQARADDDVVHLLNRATWGATATDVLRVHEMGIRQWVDWQLDYRAIEDWQTDLRLRRYDTLVMNEPDLRSFGRLPDKRMVANELATATVVRAIYSQRQLYETLVYFWSNHFNIYHFKGHTHTLKTVDDREVIRPHALGTFGDMLRASAHSTAMLFYLDNVVNTKNKPNENYAREIMELHTLGVEGAYTERDVKEVARCFTGWGMNDNHTFAYNDEQHDKGEKTVLGHTIAAGGDKSDGDTVLDILIDHPDTARYISEKLARRYVADYPSTTLINDLAKEWRDTHGDTQAVMRRLLSHDEFWDAPSKFKQPLELAISAIRATHSRYGGRRKLINRLQDMGQRPFGYVTPDGYPDVGDEWQASLAPRWNFVLDLLRMKDESDVAVRVNLADWHKVAREGGLDAIAQRLLHRPLQTAERDAIQATIGTPNTLTQAHVRVAMALLLSSPTFQYR